MDLNLMVIDDFLDNPDKVREFALNCHFTSRGQFPGVRAQRLSRGPGGEFFSAGWLASNSFWSTAVPGAVADHDPRGFYRARFAGEVFQRYQRD